MNKTNHIIKTLMTHNKSLWKMFTALFRDRAKRFNNYSKYFNHKRTCSK